MGVSAIAVRPISREDADAVARFLHENLNQAVAAEAWTKVILPPWSGEAPNHGFQLLNGDDVVGVYLAVYRDREGREGPVPVCNLAAFCVLEGFRGHGLRLVRALLAQREYDFIDLSPSGNVIGLNERLGFERLDTSTRLVINLPRIRRRGMRVTGDPSDLEATLQGRDSEVYQDHRHTACRHVLVEQAGTYAYLVFRRDRRKGLALFASPIYVGGDPTLLKATWPWVASYLLVRHRLPATLAERRILGFTRGIGWELSNPRPKMIRGNRRPPTMVDYLYSELTLVEW